MSLERILDRATDASLPAPRKSDVLEFVQEVKSAGDERDGAALILDKVLSRNEQIALNALSVLEAAVKFCGRPMHQVIDKFRFLNELIKMVSPKYYGDTPASVKTRVLYLIQKWNFNLPDHGKVREVYAMLKKQGVTFPPHEREGAIDVPCGEGFLNIGAPASERPSPLEETDPKKAAKLAKLLKSKNPDDLRQANKIIKSMVRKDQRKADRVSELRSDLVTVRNNVTVLSQMLASFNPAEGSLESNDVIQDLYRGCSDMRAKLATTAGEVDEKDDTLAEVLAANDELTRVLEMYDAVRAGRRAGVAAPADAGAMGDLSLIDFGGPATLAPTPSSSVVDQFGGLALGSSAGQPAALPTQAAPPAAAGIDLLGGLMASPAPVAQATVPPAAGGDLLGGLGDLLGGAPPAAAAAVAAPPPNLATLEIPLASIEPAQIPPTPVYDQNSIKVMFHHSKNPPHPTMCVIVVSFVNFNSVPVENLNFQAAVLKGLEVKLQMPSSTTCPANSPMGGGPATVTQVMIISNPTKAPIRMMYRFAFSLQGNNMVEQGEVNNFPAMT